jgi:hypothetical protein
MGALQVESPKCGVCVSTFTMRGVFIEAIGIATDLDKSVWCQVVPERLSRVADWPGRMASIDSGFSSSCRCMETKAQVEPPQTLAGWPLGPFDLGFGPISPRVKYTLVVMMILTFGQLYFVIP